MWTSGTFGDFGTVAALLETTFNVFGELAMFGIAGICTFACTLRGVVAGGAREGAKGTSAGSVVVVALLPASAFPPVLVPISAGNMSPSFNGSFPRPRPDKLL